MLCDDIKWILMFFYVKDFGDNLSEPTELLLLVFILFLGSVVQ